MPYKTKSTRMAVTTVAAALLLTLTACLPQDDPAPVEETTSVEKANPAPPPADTIVTVNDKPITQSDIDDLVRQRREQQPGYEAESSDLIEELISIELLHQEAESQGLHEREDIARKLRRTRSNLLVSTIIDEKVGRMNITDDMLREEYGQWMREFAGTEYKASHILVDDEEEALDALDRLAAGEEFAAIAEEISVDPLSGPKGGDLGWFSAEMMVEEFADAVRGMDPGSTTGSPVKSSFGWHIIRLDETREAEPPGFDAMRGQIQQFLMSQQIQGYINDLRSKADIVRTDR